jgi:hypothetical protein
MLTLDKDETFDIIMRDSPCIAYRVGDFSIVGWSQKGPTVCYDNYDITDAAMTLHPGSPDRVADQIAAIFDSVVESVRLDDESLLITLTEIYERLECLISTTSRSLRSCESPI